MKKIDPQQDISFGMGFPNIPRKLCIGIDAIDFPLEPNLVDELSVEKKEKILLEEYKEYSLSKEEDLIRYDKKAKSVDGLPVRNSVFTVLDRQGFPIITEDQSILDRADAKEAERERKQIEHQAKMKNDPEYARKWEIRREIMLALISGEPGSGEKPFLF